MAQTAEIQQLAADLRAALDARTLAVHETGKATRYPIQDAARALVDAIAPTPRHALPTCDGWCKGANRVTHIGAKGYVYCTQCAVQRRGSGWESTRRMREWELDLIASGQPLPSYRPIANPARVNA